MIGQILSSALLPAVSRAIDKAMPDTESRDRIKGEVTAALLENQGQLERVSAEIIKAEIERGPWLARVWRPLFALSMIPIVYILVLGVADVDETVARWVLGIIGTMVGGYTVGRSAEKIARDLPSGGILDAFRRG